MSDLDVPERIASAGELVERARELPGGAGDFDRDRLPTPRCAGRGHRAAPKSAALGTTDHAAAVTPVCRSGSSVARERSLLRLRSPSTVVHRSAL
jgi:hypothetical protein